MKYICVTHVDSVSGIPGHIKPMKNGPRHPKVKGLSLEWWDESNWPLTHPDQFPKFYGTCDDDADTEIPGVVFVFNDTETTTAKEQYDEARAQELRARLPSVASPMRIRLALLELGLLEQVQTYVESLEEPTKSKVQILWEYSTEIHKQHPAIQKLAANLGMTEETLDQIFIVATELSEDPFPEESED